MNGNFEINRAAYPYNGVRIGDSWKVMHIPTQQVVHSHDLGPALSVGVAMRLNTLYHAHTQQGPFNDKDVLPGLIREEAFNLYDDGVLAGPQYDQILLSLLSLA